jgi:hypothetical protein
VARRTTWLIDMGDGTWAVSCMACRIALYRGPRPAPSAPPAATPANPSCPSAAVADRPSSRPGAAARPRTSPLGRTRRPPPTHTNSS